MDENEPIRAYIGKKPQKTMINETQKEQVQRVVNVLDLNKRLKYFGEYLQVAYEANSKVRLTKQTERDSKIQYLSKKFYELEKQVKPKLCIMNFSVQQKVTFINFLEPDPCYQDIIRKNDPDLARLLIEALEINGRFTITSYVKFYDIFVWQTAEKKEQMEFVAKLLMKELK